MSDVLLTQTEPNVTQIVNGPVEFKNHIEFRYGLGIPPSEYINDIQVSDIAHRHEGPFNITGTKSAKIVKLDVGTIVELVNNVSKVFPAVFVFHMFPVLLKLSIVFWVYTFVILYIYFLFYSVGLFRWVVWCGT